MAENKASDSTKPAEGAEESKEEAKAPARRSSKKPSTIKIRGRVATTELAQGEEVEVERTETIDRLIANGLVEEVKA